MLAEAVAPLQAVLVIPWVSSEGLRTGGGKTASQAQISSLAHAGHQTQLNFFMRSGHSAHDTVQVLTDKFLDMEKVATGKKTKIDQGKERRKSNNLVPSPGHPG